MARRCSRLRTLLPALFLISFILWIYIRRNSLFYPGEPLHADDPSTVLSQQNYPIVSYEAAPHIEIWRQLQPLLVQYQPACDSPQLSATAGAMGYKAKDPDPRPSLVIMEEEDVMIMKAAHEGFVKAIRTNTMKLHYNPGTRGIVSTAGGSYLPVFVISLRMLRRTGSELPAEVFLANPQEYEKYVCDVILPALNARCVLLSDVLDSLPQVVKIEKYQFKPLAMLFSSFEEILFLDADAFPVQKPELLFTTEPFASYGMVTWPDFWAATISPQYYTISSQDIPPMNLQQSTESGELVVSKKTHANSLLLATYYNLWGPTHYYNLLAQGAPGQGDKDTFLAAALSVGDTIYQVSEEIGAIGHSTARGFAGTAMVQFDPAEDYSLIQRGMWRINGSTALRPRPFFVHANFPKYDPATIFEKHATSVVFEDDGETYTRAWTGPDDTISALGSDLEKHLWSEIVWTACELETKLRSWESLTGICQGVRRYWNAIYET